MRGYFRLILLAGLTGCLPLSARAQAPSSADAEFFEREVRPILANRCISCHGDLEKPKGALKLTSRGDTLRGGRQGPAAIPGKATESLLIQSVKRQGDLVMPPKEKLSQREIDALARWVELGLPWPETKSAAGSNHWAFRPVQAPPVPAVQDAAWPRGDIDRFVLAALEANGLKPAPQAEPRALIRRLHYGLIGLPPTADEVDSFVDAFRRNRQAAVEALVDRLLASPHFGVRWARHWLDNVRYADRDRSANGQTPPLHAAPYRDWVVQAFNRDLPYDQFVRLQVAGDLLPPDDTGRIHLEGLIATGVWGLALLADENEKEKVFADFVDDQLDVLGRTFLGLTLSCARCHDHKFDPIRQVDYYGLAGIFFSSRILQNQKGRVEVPLLATQAERGQLEQNRQRLAQLGKQIAEAAKASQGQADPPELVNLKAEREQLQKAIQAVPVAMAMQEGGIPGSRHATMGDMPIYIRGNHRDLGPTVPRRFPQALAGAEQKPITQGSGRKELADWLTRPDHPLTARVMANRVWGHLLGQGIVRTPSNFGQLGERPTHPELLDHLTSRFVENGWSVKKLIRGIVLSETYQQSTQSAAVVRQADPDNRLLGRMNRRRLEAEELRDSILCLTDGIRRQVEADQLATSGRSLYQPISRTTAEPLLGLFDGADPASLVPRRNDSTSAPQALYLLNHPFVLGAAGKAAERVQREPSLESRLRLAYRLILGREASAAEARLASELLNQFRARRETTQAQDGRGRLESLSWTDLCHALLCSNAFLYLD